MHSRFSGSPKKIYLCSKFQNQYDLIGKNRCNQTVDVVKVGTKSNHRHPYKRKAEGHFRLQTHQEERRD